MTANPQRYTSVAIILHWTTAILLIYMLWAGEGLIKGQPWMNPPVPGTNANLHVELGFLILILTIARLAWRLMNPPPPDVPMPAWQAMASHALHWAFYAVLLLIPISGLAELARSIAGKHPDFATLSFFNLFTMPSFSMPWLASLHDPMTNVAWALLAVHVLAALKHQFIDKDKLINRMLPH